MLPSLRTATGAHIDVITHEMLLHKFHADKKYKKVILDEIIAAICAMLNSNGGKVVIHLGIRSDEISLSQLSLVIRIVEQQLIKIIGPNITRNVDFKEDNQTVTIFVRKADSLITIDYHLYFPSQTQVVQVPPSQPMEKVKNEIVQRKIVDEPVQQGSHCKIFQKEKICGFLESKTIQLKNLKADSSKKITLADRMTSKSNKFSCYVSAFANFRGGHIYYGINDNDTVVEGEFVRSDEKKKEITKKVEKAINSMIWPEQVKRGIHWEIFFEQVLDKKSKPIPSTFVIVIYIAPCVGGVFTKEPECYEMVEGKIVKMSLITWKERLMQSSELFHLPITPFTVKHVTWGSSKIQKIYFGVDQILVETVNNEKSIQAISSNLKREYPEVIEVRLSILAKKVMVKYRSCSFTAARNLLKKFNACLKKTTEVEMFNTIRRILETGIYRGEGDVNALNDTLIDCLSQAESMTPGIISARIHLLAASVTKLSQPNDEGELSVVHSLRALEHLQNDRDSPTVRADLEQKAHITLAQFYLGENRFVQLNRKAINSTSLEKAKSSIMAVNKSVCEGNPISRYREIQFILVQSVLFYRYSQIHEDRKVLDLKQAFDFAKKAECLATSNNFEKMLNWARNCMALYTEDLVRTHFMTRDTFNRR